MRRRSNIACPQNRDGEFLDLLLMQVLTLEGLDLGSFEKNDL